VPRGRPEALIEDVAIAVARLQQWQLSGKMPTIDGGSVAVRAQTLCVHADSPDALQLLVALNELLEAG